MKKRERKADGNMYSSRVDIGLAASPTVIRDTECFMPLFYEKG